MSETQTVFVVVREDYSDSWVTGVFRTEEGAQAHIDAVADGPERDLRIIEEFPLGD